MTWTLSPAELVWITRALLAGADARLITVPGAGHGFPQATLDEQFEHIFAFLKEKGVLYH